DWGGWGVCYWRFGWVMRAGRDPGGWVPPGRQDRPKAHAHIPLRGLFSPIDLVTEIEDPGFPLVVHHDADGRPFDLVPALAVPAGGDVIGDPRFFGADHPDGPVGADADALGGPRYLLPGLFLPAVLSPSIVHVLVLHHPGRSFRVHRDLDPAAADLVPVLAVPAGDGVPPGHLLGPHDPDGPIGADGNLPRLSGELFPRVLVAA